MILLTATTHALELQTSSSASTDWTCSYVDMDASATTPGSAQGNVSSATTTTIAAAPAASTQRQIKHISVRNKGTVAQTVTLKKDVSSTEYTVFTATLGAGEGAEYADGKGWGSFDAQGRSKTVEPDTTSQSGSRALNVQKTGTAAEAAAYWYSFWKDTGNPGAWAPGTPGVDGRVTDGTDVADAGCLPIWAPDGSLFLESATVTTNTTCFPVAFDVLWVNTGLSVTTTGAQAIVTPTLPARDDNGTVNGEGCMIGLVWTAASTNAAAISNSTVTYTNSDGTGSRTATLSTIVGENIPATPVIGTTVWFKLNTGDRGVKSIESISLGTSLVTGSVSLIIARPIVTWAVSLANIGFTNVYPFPGLRLWNGTCALMFHRAVGTTAVALFSVFNVSEQAGFSGGGGGGGSVTLTGDVTGSGTGSFATTIANGVVTYAKMQDVSATDRILGRSSAGSGDVEEITCTSAGRALLDDADATAQRTTLGLGTLATQSGTFSGTSSGTNTGDQNLFSTISVAGQSDVIADSTGDTLTLVAGSNVTITTNASTDTITIAATGSSGAPTSAEYLVKTADGTLSAERVVGDSTSVVANWATGGQVTFERAALTGDVTASANSNTTSIASGAVTYAKIQNVSATDRLLGRVSSGAGVVEEITCTSAGRALLDDADSTAQRTTLGLGTLATQSGTFSGTSSGTNTGDQTITLTGDVTGSGTGSFAATIANNAVTYAKLQDVSATDRILGRSSAGSGDVQEITCTAAGRAILDDADAPAQRTTLGLGTIATQASSSVSITGGTVAGVKFTDYTEAKTAPTISSGTLTLNLNDAQVFDVSLNANITTLTISNTDATSNTVNAFTLIFTMDGTARTVTWPAAVKWAGGTAPTLTSTNAKKDVLSFMSPDNGTTWLGFVGGQNY